MSRKGKSNWKIEDLIKDYLLNTNFAIQLFQSDFKVVQSDFKVVCRVEAGNIG